jgi:hypothetical protein
VPVIVFKISLLRSVSPMQKKFVAERNLCIYNKNYEDLRKKSSLGFYKIEQNYH